MENNSIVKEKYEKACDAIKNGEYEQAIYIFENLIYKEYQYTNDPSRTRTDAIIEYTHLYLKDIRFKISDKSRRVEIESKIYNNLNEIFLKYNGADKTDILYRKSEIQVLLGLLYVNKENSNFEDRKMGQNILEKSKRNDKASVFIYDVVNQELDKLNAISDENIEEKIFAYKKFIKKYGVTNYTDCVIRDLAVLYLENREVNIAKDEKLEKFIFNKLGKSYKNDNTKEKQALLGFMYLHNLGTGDRDKETTNRRAKSLLVDVGKSKKQNELLDRFFALEYDKAKKYEEIGNYKKAEKIYRKIIDEYGEIDVSSKAKVELSRLFIERKISKVDATDIRRYLEEAYNEQHYVKAGKYLGYLYSHNIGLNPEENKKSEAKDLFEEAYKVLRDTSPMVYTEYANLVFNFKTDDERKAQLLGSVSKEEQKNLKALEKLQKNQSIFSKLRNVFFINKDLEESAYDKQELYEKGCWLIDEKQYEEAREVFRRLHLDKDIKSSVKYAGLLYKGYGGEKDYISAQKIYERVINSVEKRIKDIDSTIIAKKQEVEELSNSFAGNKKRKILNKEIEELEEKRNKISGREYYKDAVFNYGLLLTKYSALIEEPTERETIFKSGIDRLMSLAKTGETISKIDEELTNREKRSDKYARKAIHALGDLYESKRWQPTEKDIPEVRSVFLRFSSGKMAPFVLRIADNMKENPIARAQIINQTKSKYKAEKKKIGFFGNKINNAKFEIAQLFELFNHPRARKIYKSLIESGDYRAAFYLGALEQNGKCGSKDVKSAIEHFQLFSNYVTSIKSYDKDILKHKFIAENNIGELLLEQNDIPGAIEKFKICAKAINLKSAKVHLLDLFGKHAWKPQDAYEEQLIAGNSIERALQKIRKREIAKEKQIILQEKENNEKNQLERKQKIIRTFKPVTAMAASLAFLLGNNVSISTNKVIEKTDNTVKNNIVEQQIPNKKTDEIIENNVYIPAGALDSDNIKIQPETVPIPTETEPTEINIEDTTNFDFEDDFESFEFEDEVETDISEFEDEIETETETETETDISELKVKDEIENFNNNDNWETKIFNNNIDEYEFETETNSLENENIIDEENIDENIQISNDDTEVEKTKDVSISPTPVVQAQSADELEVNEENKVTIVTPEPTATTNPDDNIENKSSTGNENTSLTVGDTVNYNSEDGKIIGVVAVDPNNKPNLSPEELNINNTGLNTEEYLKQVANEKNMNEDDLVLLYCIEDESGNKNWVTENEISNTQEKENTENKSNENNDFKEDDDLVIE